MSDTNPRFLSWKYFDHSLQKSIFIKCFIIIINFINNFEVLGRKLSLDLITVAILVQPRHRSHFPSRIPAFALCLSLNSLHRYSPF
jgi:hypothetical protein